MSKSTCYSYIVVEDELKVCENIRNRMEKYTNWECFGLIPFYDEALKIILSKKPQLLFLDYSIRGGNSFSLLDEIEKIENYRPYIIFFTAYLSEKPEIAEDALNVYRVNKYLNKPVFEKLTNFLDNYIVDTEKWIYQHSSLDFWIETIDKLKIKLEKKSVLCISQSRISSRNKIIHTIDRREYEIKANWKTCEEIAEKIQMDYFFANNRDTLVNRLHISKVKKPFIWLDDFVKVEVTKLNWKDVYISF